MIDELDDFVPESTEGDPVKASELEGHPLIVRVLDYREGLTTKFSPDGDGKAVIVDILDLSDSKVYLASRLYNAAIRDNLRGKVGKTMPIKISLTPPKKKGGNEYLMPVMLEGDDLEAARAWAKAKPNIFEDTRTERGVPPYSFADVSDDIGVTQREDTSKTKASAPPASNGPKAMLPGDSAPVSPPASAGIGELADDDEPPF